MKKSLLTLILILIVSVSFAQLGAGYSKSQANDKFATKAQLMQLDTTTLKVSDGVFATDYFMLKDTIDSKLAKKANLYHPALVSPTANTLPVGTNNTGLATMAALKSQSDLDKQPTLLKDIQLFGSTVGAIPIGIYTLNWASGAFALTDTKHIIQAYRINESFNCSSIGYELNAAGDFTGDNYNGFVVYSFSGGVLTEITRTADDANVWKGTLGSRAKALPATITLMANTIYYIGYCYNNSAQVTAPSIGGIATSFPATLPGTSIKLSGYLTGVTNPTSPINVSSLNTVAFPAWVWFNKD